jgi:hypothetical protein
MMYEWISWLRRSACAVISLQRRAVFAQFRRFENNHPLAATAVSESTMTMLRSGYFGRQNLRRRLAASAGAADAALDIAI